MTLTKKMILALMGFFLALSLAIVSHSAHAATFVTVKLKAYNGQCLTIANANVGTQVVTADCAHAHAWWYYPTLGSGTLRPSGHDNVAIGDSGGHAALVASNTAGSHIASDGSEGGPASDPTTLYQRLYYTVLSTNGRLHSNGLNSNITVQKALSNADFYAFNPG